MVCRGRNCFSYELMYISRRSTSRLIPNNMRTVIRQYTYTISIRMCIGEEGKWLLTDLSASFLFDIFVVLQARSVISYMMLIKVVTHPVFCLLSTKDRNCYLRKRERTQVRLLWVPDGHPVYRYQSGYLKTKLRAFNNAGLWKTYSAIEKLIVCILNSSTINCIEKTFFCDRSRGHEVLCVIQFVLDQTHWVLFHNSYTNIHASGH